MFPQESNLKNYIFIANFSTLTLFHLTVNKMLT